MFEKNASYLYVGNAASTAADTAAISTIAVGSVAFCTEDGKVEKSAAVTSGKLRVAQKLADGTMIFSPEFDMSKIKNIVGKSYVAPTQQISYLGYNGSAGAMDATAGADFVLHVQWNNTQGMYSNKPIIFSSAYHTTAASQSELSFGLIESLDGVLKRQPYKFVNVNRINNAAVTVGNLLDHNATVVKDLTAITVATNLTYAATVGTLAVGDYLRIGAVGLGGALTSPVYKVTAIDSLVVTLDRPVTNASGTYATATVDIEVIPAASIGANWGLKFEGVENTTFNAINDTWSLTRFDLLLGGFVTATVTKPTAANEGSGYYKEVANLEVYSQFLDKSPFISAYPRNNYRSEVSSVKTYDICSFDVSEVAVVGNATGIATYKTFNIKIATDVALTGDDIDTVLAVTV